MEKLAAAMQGSGKLDLRNVTVCAADSVTVALAARALRHSMALCDFGDAIFFTDAPIAGDFRTVKIDRLASRADYSRFVFKDLANFIATPFALVLQWDGYVLDPSAWRPSFLQFDYIGAKWPWHHDAMSVGNGGFSLRSRKLLESTAADRYPLLQDVPEDELICRHYRQALMADAGIRFAPVEVADAFAY